MSMSEEKEFSEHLEELVYRLRICFFTWIITTGILSFVPLSLFSFPPKLTSSEYVPLVQYLMNKIREDLLPEEVVLIAGTWLDPIGVYFIAAALLGFLASLPIISYEIYAFVKPAIYPHEKKISVIFITSFLILFTLGATIAYFFILPVTFRILMFFVYSIGATPLFFLGEFYNFVFFGVLVTGLVFTFPCVVALLTMAGIIDQETLKENRPYAILAIFVATAVFTPDPTPFSMLVLSVPLTILYEISVWVAGRLEVKSE